MVSIVFPTEEDRDRVITKSCPDSVDSLLREEILCHCLDHDNCYQCWEKYFKISVVEN